MEAQLADLVERLLQIGHEVTVIARRHQLPEHGSLRVRRIPGPRRPFALAYPSFLVLASRAVRRERQGIVHATGAIVGNRVDLITVHLCHRAFAETTTILRSRHNTWWYRVHRRVAAALSRTGETWCYRPGRVRVLVAVSEGGRAELRRHFPELAEAVQVIPNGVDADRFRPCAGDLPGDRPLRALFVGREWDAKRLDLVIAALSRAPAWRLEVVGDGDVPRFTAAASAAGVADRVMFVGHLEDVAPAYRDADAFVLPSAYETFSMAAHEASASGLPIIASAVGGVEELVEDGVSGWFVAPDAAEIASRLNQLGSDPALRARMSAAARERALRYQPAMTAARYSELYRRLDSWGSGRPAR
jgi:UDP-glucose:(heptosyl)LPS alpha-1,3-glucosyltransferase